MKKIFVDKTEGAVSVVDRIIGETDADIVLVIPKESALKDSVSNFHLMRREAAAAGKNLSIESVDEEVLAFAKAGKIAADHPLLRNDDKPPSLFDIAPRKRNSKVEEKIDVKPKEKKINGGVKTVELVSKEEAPKTSVAAPSQPAPKMIVSNEPPPILKSSPRLVVYMPTPSPTPIVERRIDIKDESPIPAKRGRLRIVIWVIIPLILLSGVAWGADMVFQKAVITINFKKTPWTYDNSFLADTSATKANSETRTLPAELFTQSKNVTQLFPASDNRNVSFKATGKITIYNAYSSASQILVATTRFATPDGKIFRLIDQVIVPAAQVKDGKIIPASVEAAIVADKAGEEYNVGSIDRMTIPGFKGTPRYEKFYGELRETTTGGFVGKKPAPSAQDIASAKTKTTEVLKSGLQGSFTSSRPEEFIMIPGAEEVIITKLTVNENTDSSGNFTVFGEARLRAIGFRDADLRSTLTDLSDSNAVFEELQLDYSNVRAEFDRGRLQFGLKANSVLRPVFDPDGFETSILGKSGEDVRSLVLALPEVQGAKISLWPFWRRGIPGNPERVEVLLQ